MRITNEPVGYTETTLCVCPFCESENVGPAERSVRQEDGSRLRWRHCRNCKARFKELAKRPEKTQLYIQPSEIDVGRKATTRRDETLKKPA